MLKMIKYDFKSIFYNTPYITCLSLLILYVFIITYTIINTRDSLYIGSYYVSSFITNAKTTPTLNAFLLLLPLVCSLYMGKYMIDESKVRKLIISKSKRSTYLISKLLSSFLSAFFMCFIVLFLSVVYMMIIVPESIDLSYTSFALSVYEHRINEYVGLIDLYLNKPFTYIILSIVLISLFSGLYAQLTTVVSLYTNNKMIIYLMSFFVVVISNYLIIVPSINSMLMPSIQIRFVAAYTPILLSIYMLVFVILILYMSFKYLAKDEL